MLALFFSYEVCERRFTGGDTPEEACRKLDLTDPPVVALGLVLLLSLSAFFSEISGFGLTLKRELRAVQDDSRIARGDAREAKQVADGAAGDAAQARGASASANQVAETAQETSIAAARGDAAALTSRSSDDSDAVRVLAEEYNRIRRNQRSGSRRTSAMTGVVGRMIALLSRNPAAAGWPGVSDFLAGDDGGLRLAGFLSCYTNPDPRRIQEVAQAVLRDETPFGQYCGLRSLNRLLALDPESLDRNTRRQLSEWGGTLGAGTDRAFELRRALQVSAST
ncbi:MAG: hypothetical protein H0T66_01630 [Geodermatophilaceae bacterium]|nr:hypothetical protein [Geodermatophilaceae bacterium]